MVVRHYPDTSPPSASITTPRHHSLPQTSLTQTPLTPRNLSRHQHVSGTMSEPPCPNDAPLMEPQCPIDTPKKPPRPLDSVLRERCKSNNELDMHFKTVHNPKRLSQIYGDSNLFLRFVKLGCFFLISARSFEMTKSLVGTVKLYNNQCPADNTILTDNLNFI